MHPARTHALLPAILVALSVGPAAPPIALAQNAPAASPTQPRLSTPNSDPRTFSVDFPGGALESYIDALKKAAGDLPVNVSVAGELKHVQVPAITLHNVSPFLALQVLQQSTDAANQTVTVNTVTDVTGNTLYLVRPIQTPQPFPPARAKDADDWKPTRLVISLSPLLANTPEEKRDAQLATILSAVEAALKLGRDPGDAMPDIALHKESGLFLMLGGQDDQKTVQSVMQQIRDGMVTSGGEWGSKEFDLLFSDSNTAVRTIREVYPDNIPGLGMQYTIKINSPSQIKVSGPAARVWQIEGVLRYFDRQTQESPEIVQLRTQLDMRERQFAELRDSSQRRALESEAKAEKSVAQATELTRQLVSAQAQADARKDDIDRLQARLQTAETLISQLRSSKNPDPPKP